MQIQAAGIAGPRRPWWVTYKLGLICILLLTLIVSIAGWLHQRQQLAAASRLSEDLQVAMEADNPSDYARVVDLGQTLLPGQPDTYPLAAMVAYAATVLAVEHQSEAMGDLSRKLIPPIADHAAEGESAWRDEAEGYDYAARLLRLYGDGAFKEALALVEQVGLLGRGYVMAKLEALRFLVAAKQGNPNIAVAAQRLAEDVGNEVRALVYLGLWHLSENNTAQAQAYFNKALVRNPHHPQALLGLAWVALFVPHPNKEALWHAHRTVGDVLRLGPHLLTPPVHATALLVRGLAYEWEGEGAHAVQDRADAMGLDPSNLLHDVAPQAPLRP